MGKRGIDSGKWEVEREREREARTPEVGGRRTGLIDGRTLRLRVNTEEGRELSVIVCH